MEALFILWKFWIFVANQSWFQVKILFGLEMKAFWKNILLKNILRIRSTKKPVFRAPETGLLLGDFKFFAKMPYFTGAGLYRTTPNSKPRGIDRKLMSISFFLYFIWVDWASGEANVTSWKSGLNFTALEMVISVLGNGAVLVVHYCHSAQLIKQGKMIRLWRLSTLLNKNRSST